MKNEPLLNFSPIFEEEKHFSESTQSNNVSYDSKTVCASENFENKNNLVSMDKGKTDGNLKNIENENNLASTTENQFYPRLKLYPRLKINY